MFPSFRMRRRATLVLFLALSTMTTGFAQNNAPPASPTFEAASIKLTSATDGHQHIYFDDPTHVRFINQPLNKLIEFAYGITDRELVAPDWLGGESFDITAVTLGPSTKVQMYEMLRAFLAEQFKLQIHHESREQPVYALVVAKGGVKVPKEDEGGTTINTGARTGHIEMARTVALFIQTLANYTDRPVIDRTGLDGIYHFNLTWTLDQALNSTAADIPNAPPQLFTAIEEQLGLKLTPQRGPVDTIVVDHCEKTPVGDAY